MIAASILSFVVLFSIRLMQELNLSSSSIIALFQKTMDIVTVITSAAAVFASNYYGKLSLQRKITGHEKMISLYKEALRRYEDGNDHKYNIFQQLARESIVENGDWLAYCRHESPSLSI